MTEQEKAMANQMVLGATEKSVLSFCTFLRSQGILVGKATAEEMEILRSTFKYAYKEYCKRNNFEMELE